ncbi:MAG: hypothetical protein GX100_04730 [candidate division WS1 bacterium]|nr:hypothetical protein [candidate division WS1 bacterium]
MSLQSLVQAQQLKQHQTSRNEISRLLALADRSRRDAASTDISTDLRFTAAYNAALALATLVLHAAGYRTAGVGHHRLTFECLPLVLGAHYRELGQYLNRCRGRRNVAEYQQAGQTTSAQVEELLEATAQFRTEALEWLARHHAELVP